MREGHPCTFSAEERIIECVGVRKCGFSLPLFPFQIQCFYIFNLKKKHSPFLTLDGGGEQIQGGEKVMSVGHSQGRCSGNKGIMLPALSLREMRSAKVLTQCKGS